jgi:hypothetical protein
VNRLVDAAGNLSTLEAKPIKKRAPVVSSKIWLPRWFFIDLYRCCHSRHQPNAAWDVVEVDAHRYTLREANPREDRIYRGEAGQVRLRIWHIDAAGYASYMPQNDFPVPHQFDRCAVSLANFSQVCLLEIGVDPK